MAGGGLRWGVEPICTVLTEHVRAISQTDALTRVANRRRFDEALDTELRQAAVTGTELALAIDSDEEFAVEAPADDQVLDPATL